MSKYARGGPQRYFPPEVELPGMAKPLAVPAPFPLSLNGPAEDLSQGTPRRFSVEAVHLRGQLIAYLVRDLRGRVPVNVEQFEVAHSITHRHALALARAKMLECERDADREKAEQRKRAEAQLAARQTLG